MAEISRFFNSIDHDRQYSAADWAAFFASFIGNGVMPQPSSQLMVSVDDGEGLAVSIAPGFAFINGYNYQLTAALTKTLATASGTNPRIDRVVVRFSRSLREIFIDVLTGTAAATPTAPSLTRTSDVYELCLADIAVARGATELTQANITDTRGDEDVCGFCTWMFSEAGENYDDFWAQFQTQFNEWMASLEGQIDPDTAAGLAARMVELTPVDISLTLAASGWAYDSTSSTWSLLVPASSITYESDGATVVYPVGDATAAYVDLDMSAATASTAEDLQADWSLVGRVYVDASGLHAICYGDAPAGSLPVILRVVDKG